MKITLTHINHMGLRYNGHMEIEAVDDQGQTVTIDCNAAAGIAIVVGATSIREHVSQMAQDVLAAVDADELVPN